MRTVTIGKGVEAGGGRLLLIAGPCVLESRELALEVALGLKEITARLGLGFVFKASFDKANRTSLSSFRGPGLDKGLAMLAEVAETAGVAVVSDVHETWQVEPAARVLDLIQIPAFLCRQTDLLLAAARSGRPVNIKKGQFLAPADMAHAVAKLEEGGAAGVLVTERGTMFGYNNLVVDMRSFAIMREFGHPLVYDATHSVQLPGGAGGASGGRREFIPHLCRAAVAAGVEGLFMEVHPDPDRALCDGPNSMPLDRVEPLLEDLVAIHRTVAPMLARD